MEKRVQPQQPAAGQQTQKTRKGLEIPVPSREEIADAFRRIIQPTKRG